MKRRNSRYVCLSEIKNEEIVKPGRKYVKSTRERMEEENNKVLKVSFNFNKQIWEDFQTIVTRTRLDGKKVYPTYIFESIMADFLDHNYIFDFLAEKYPEILEEYQKIYGEQFTNKNDENK